MFSKTAVNPLRKKKSQNLGFFTHFWGIFCQNANFSGYTEISELKIFLVKDICSYKSILYYWPKSAVMTLKIRPISDKNHFFPKMTFFGDEISGVGRNFWQKKISEISSPKNILSEKYRFCIVCAKRYGNIWRGLNPPKIARLNNGFSWLSTH